MVQKAFVQTNPAVAFFSPINFCVCSDDTKYHHFKHHRYADAVFLHIELGHWSQLNDLGN